MITFSNPGEIDLRLLTTMGANVKLDDESIGIFGTGLKYSIATLLRNGCSVVLYRGLRRYEFFVTTETIRGKAFDIIHYREGDTQDEPGEDKSLNITTDLGRNWTLENAYRELWSNCMDEKGEVLNCGITPEMGRTLIKVEGLDQVHAERDSFILNKSLYPILYADTLVEIRAGMSKRVFYRGIAVHDLDSPANFTYNILSQLELTEDRTANSSYDLRWAMIHGFMRMTPDRYIPAILSEGTFENTYDYKYTSPPSAFIEHVLSQTKGRFLKLPPSLVSEAYRVKPSAKPDFDEYKPTLGELAAVDMAIGHLAKAGFYVARERLAFAHLGDKVLGTVRNGKIYLAPLAFKENELIHTLLEELAHLESQSTDGTRVFQNYLISHLIRLVEQVNAN